MSKEVLNEMVMFQLKVLFKKLEAGEIDLDEFKTLIGKIIDPFSGFGS